MNLKALSNNKNQIINSNNIKPKVQTMKFNNILKNKTILSETTENKKIELPKNYKFKNKKDALDYVKNNFNFSNCTFEEYNKGMMILSKNKLLSKDQIIDWGIQGCIRNAPKINNIKTTNPVYLKFMSNTKQNWFENIKNFALQQMSTGNPDGESMITAIKSLEQRLEL